jgi:hypothetical protein
MRCAAFQKALLLASSVLNALTYAVNLANDGLQTIVTWDKVRRTWNGLSIHIDPVYLCRIPCMFVEKDFTSGRPSSIHSVCQSLRFGWMFSKRSRRKVSALILNRLLVNTDTSTKDTLVSPSIPHG